MKKILALLLSAILTLQLLTFNTSFAATVLENINTSTGNEEVVTILETPATLTELGLDDYLVLFTKALSKSERKTIATTVYNNGLDYSAKA